MGLLQGRQLNAVHLYAIQVLAQFHHEQEESKWDRWTGLLSRVAIVSNPMLTQSPDDVALWFPDDDAEEVEVTSADIDHSEGQWDFSQTPLSPDDIIAMRTDVVSMGMEDLDLRPDFMRDHKVLRPPTHDEQTAALIQDAYNSDFGQDDNGAWQ